MSYRGVTGSFGGWPPNGFAATADLAYEAAKAAVAQLHADPAAFSDAERAAGRKNVDLDLYKTAFFLYGLALENLLKGTLIARDPSRFHRQKDFTHGLLKYFEEVGIPLTLRQQWLVEQVDVLVWWKGRYPTPKKKKYWALREGPGWQKRNAGFALG